MSKIGLMGMLTATLCTFACADIKVEVPNICNTSQVGTIYPSYQKVTTLQTTVDVSQEVDQIQKTFDQLYIKLTSLDVTADQDLSWLQDMKITIDGGTASAPNVTLATYQPGTGDPGMSLPIKLMMDANTLFEYLSQPITLTFTITGSPPSEPANFTSSFCVDLTGEINK
jgi:hypothetical protein